MQNYIGNNVRAFRIHKGLSQEQLADAAGVGQSTVSSWEASETTPRKSNIQRLIETFPELEFDDIFSEESGFAKKALSRRVSGWVEVPFFGSIAAGEPIEMIDRGDTYLIPQSIAIEHPNSGVFQAAGNSWNKGGIFDGFYIVVDFDIVEPANEHEPFAVSINDTCTVKSIQRLENGVRLLPNSYDETIKPIVLDYDDNDGTMAKTLGKVVWTFAPFNYGF